MINASAFFAADRYIRTRVLLLFLCGLPISIAAILEERIGTSLSHWWSLLSLFALRPQPSSSC